jgi:transcription elongation GreA/GreB family factor
VTITGQNLAGATKVAFNGLSATITSDTATKIVTQVPVGATKGYISVRTPAGTATSATTFNVMT